MKKLLTIAFKLGLTMGLASFSILACSHNRVRFENGEGIASSEKDNKGLSVQTVWVKNKKDSIDLYLMMTNNYPHPISFKRSAITMTFNGKPTRLKKSNFSGEIAAGGFEKELVMFESGGEFSPNGTAVMKIDPIFDDTPNGEKAKKLPPLTLTLNIQEKN